MDLKTTIITLSPPVLPVNYCPAGYQQLASDIIGGTVAQFQSTIGNSFFNTGAGPISADNRIYPWLDNDGNWWIWSTNYGVWIRKNPEPASGDARRIYVGTTTALKSYDGGDGTDWVLGTSGDASGAMWQVDTAMAARFPVGVGAFAASGNVTVQGTTTDAGVSGEDKHVLLSPEIPKHTHSIDNQYAEYAQRGSADYLAFTTLTTAEATGALRTTSSFGGDSSGNTTGHNTLPPFYGVYFIKRTPRIYYAR